MTDGSLGHLGIFRNVTVGQEKTSLEKNTETSSFTSLDFLLHLQDLPKKNTNSLDVGFSLIVFASCLQIIPGGRNMCLVLWISPISKKIRFIQSTKNILSLMSIDPKSQEKTQKQQEHLYILEKFSLLAEYPTSFHLQLHPSETQKTTGLFGQFGFQIVRLFASSLLFVSSIPSIRNVFH